MRQIFSVGLTVTIFLINVQSSDQVRLICHIATDQVNFNNTLIVANLSEETKSYSIFAYSDAGIQIGAEESQTIIGSSTRIADLGGLFSSIPGYLVIEGDTDLVISVGYSSTSESGTSAFVHETNEVSRGYRLYPGNWNTVFDGIALLNINNTSTNVSIEQKSETGEVLNSINAVVDAGAKLKMVLDSNFPRIDRTFFEILSTEPIAMVALCGSLPGVSPSYLWVNPVIPFVPGTSSEAESSFRIVDTNQTTCYDNVDTFSCGSSQSFFGQDAQYDGYQPQYIDNGDGTVTDIVTGLMWQQDPGSKKTYNVAVAGANTFSLADYTDWRLPTIKELYSLILFSGVDPSGYSGSGTSGLIPFIDHSVFTFEYGDESIGERIIDSQFASSTTYVSTTMNGAFTDFGVNFADGRIKGYGTEALPGQTEGKTFFVCYVRGNTDYGINNFVDHGDGTVSDSATELMWMQLDSGDLGAGVSGAGGMNWEQALNWAENLDYAGYSDWRLPNVKELQSIVDYTRSPDTSNSAAIDPLFSVTEIINEGGVSDYPFYWSGTTHANWTSNNTGGSASYVVFGRGLGWMQDPSGGNYTLMDVHGAGCQRSDPKTGDPDDYPYGHGPQGDVIRIFNHVRCVR